MNIIEMLKKNNDKKRNNCKKFNITNKKYGRCKNVSYCNQNCQFED